MIITLSFDLTENASFVLYIFIPYEHLIRPNANKWSFFSKTVYRVQDLFKRGNSVTKYLYTLGLYDSERFFF